MGEAVSESDSLPLYILYDNTVKKKKGKYDIFQNNYLNNIVVLCSRTVHLKTVLIVGLFLVSLYVRDNRRFQSIDERCLAGTLTFLSDGSTFFPLARSLRPLSADGSIALDVWFRPRVHQNV